jgi:ribokinase
MGAINWDVSIFERRFARPGEEVPVRRVEEYSGGKGANVAVSAARILGPGRVALVAALGDDEASGMQVAGLRDEGVSVDGLAILRGRRSGRAYIVVDGEGRKTIHTHFGANEELQASHLSSRGVRSVLANSAIVVIMDTPLAFAREAARIARYARAMMVYSPGVRTMEGIRRLDDVISSADTLVLDSNELRNLCRTSDLRAALQRLTKRYPDLTLVATLWPLGCLVSRGGQTSRVEGVRLPRLGLKAVNSTGSGDAFLGVFVSYLLMRRQPVEAAAFANLAGALKATRYETRGSPTRSELEEKMKVLERVRH